MSENPTVEVFADIGCPFTYVGLHRILAERDRRGSKVRLHVRAWPLELVNNAPFDTDHLDAEIVGMRDTVAPELFAGFNPQTFPRTSLPAFGLAHVAYEKSLDCGEQVSMALRTEIFEHGRDVSDPAVLGEVASRFGLVLLDMDTAEELTRTEWREGKALGVIGSPHFLFPTGEGAFCPGLTIKRRDDGSFDIAPDVETMGSIFEQMFALGSAPLTRARHRSVG